MCFNCSEQGHHAHECLHQVEENEAESEKKGFDVQSTKQVMMAVNYL